MDQVNRNDGKLISSMPTVFIIPQNNGGEKPDGGIAGRRAAVDRDP